MSRKHAELERELIDDLVPRTGRSLEDWMAAIGAAGLADKNAIIDWLRPQGLTFAHASWLERIHNNGGRPIYLDAAGSEGAVPATPAATAATSPAATTPRAVPHAAGASPRAAAPPPVLVPGGPPTAAGTPLEVLLARGKGLRPLAELVLREIARTLPGLEVAVSGELVSLRHPAELAVLRIAPRELRLGLDLGDAPFEGALVRARIAGTGPRITHMVAVSDARLVGTLLDLVQRADARANARA